MYMQTGAAAMASGLPFSVYGETLIITVQNLIIIMMIWYYNKKIDSLEKFVAALIIGMYGAILFTKGNFGLIGQSQWGMITSSTGLLSKFTRGLIF